MLAAVLRVTMAMQAACRPKLFGATCALPVGRHHRQRLNVVRQLQHLAVKAAVLTDQTSVAVRAFRKQR